MEGPDGDRFAPIQIHGADAYVTEWGDERILYCGVGSYPTTVQDGVLMRVGAYSVATYISDFAARVDVPTDVTLELSGAVITGSTYQIDAVVGLEESGTAKSVRVHIVQVLDDYPSGSYYRNCVMQGADAEDVYLEPGDVYAVQREMTFTSPSWDTPEDIRIVAWVQDVGEFSDESEVFQAAVMPWPFEAPPETGDCNCDGMIDFFDIDPFVMAMTTPETYEATYPDCDLSTADCNLDGIVDFFDIDPFIALITK